ncbi:MAG TPA: prolipoprotein diacylglyceryl transferase [Polyangiaceae bacterium]
MPKFTWDIDPAIFHLGWFQLRYYSLLFVVVFLGGYALLKWQIVRGGGDEEEAGDFVIYGVLGVLVGARLGHVLFYDLEKALKDPIWIFKIWTGGLASHGAVIGLITAMYLFCKRRGLPFLEGADRFSFSAALGASIVRLGNFFNSEIVGRRTDQTWGVKFPRYDQAGTVWYRHPSQLYEMTWGLCVLGALLLFDRRLGKENRPRGALISLFFALYFVGRFFIEYVKEYQVSITPEDAPLSMGQYLSIPGIFLGFYGLYWSFRRRRPARWASQYDEGEEEEEDEKAGEEEEEEDGEEETEATEKGRARDPDVEAEFASRDAKRPRRESPDTEPDQKKQSEKDEGD